MSAPVTRSAEAASVEIVPRLLRDSIRQPVEPASRYVTASELTPRRLQDGVLQPFPKKPEFMFTLKVVIDSMQSQQRCRRQSGSRKLLQKFHLCSNP